MDAQETLISNLTLFNRDGSQRWDVDFFEVVKSTPSGPDTVKLTTTYEVRESGNRNKERFYSLFPYHYHDGKDGSLLKEKQYSLEEAMKEFVQIERFLIHML